MEAENFEEGDVVFLKSGGPKMTIYMIEGNDVSCSWFDKDRNVKYTTFRAKTLTKTDPD